MFIKKEEDEESIDAQKQIERLGLANNEAPRVVSEAASA